MSHQELYSVLGVAADATVDQIRRGYKKAALRWHPDKNTDATASGKREAERMFKKCGQAYEVLSNADTRRRYDQYGMEGVTGDSAGGGGGGGGADGRGQPQQQQQQQQWSSGSPGFGADPAFGMYQQQGGHHNFRDPFEVFQSFFATHEAMMQEMMGAQGHGQDGRAGGGQPHQSQHASAGNRQRQGGGWGQPPQQQQPQQQQQWQQQPQPYHQPQQPQRVNGGGMGGMGGFPSMFGNDPFFNGGGMMGMGMPMMGGGGGGPGGGFGAPMMSSSSFSSSSMGGPGMTSQSVSSTTEIRNGQRVTKTITRTQDASGRVTEDVQEHAEDLPAASTRPSSIRAYQH